MRSSQWARKISGTRIRDVALTVAFAAVLGACGGNDDPPASKETVTTPAAVKGGIARIEITSRQPAFGGASFGTVGAYELLKGKAYGVLDPANPAHARLSLLDKAQKNSAGLVEYSMDFNLLRPVEASSGSARLFYEVVNRGNPLSFGILNKGSLTDPGNGFLMRQGYEIVWSGWQPEANPVTASNKAYFPIAQDNGQPITAKVMEVIIPDTPETSANATHSVSGKILTTKIAYNPVTTDIAGATVSLTVRENYDDPRVTLSPSAVTFSGDLQVKIDMSEAIGKGFDAGAIYELIYQAKDPYVGGVGFVSVRDLVSFLKNETKDSAGNENPARPGGMPIKAAYAWGDSQSGRFLKNFVYEGFHTDLQGRLVFEGIHPVVAGGRMTDHNMPFAMTSRWLRQHEERNYPGAEFPFTYPTLSDALTGRTDGVLNRCSRSNNCPKIFHQDSDLEFWHGKASLITTDTAGRHVDMPDNVRIYLMSGQTHTPGNGTPTGPSSTCKLQNDPVDNSPVYRALVVAMDKWVLDGVPPPPSIFPNVNAGTLQTLTDAAKAWPSIPGYPFNSRMALAQVGDYSTVPPKFGASYPLFVAKMDAQGTGIGGVIGPDLAAPLGTYMGRNFRAAGHAEDELCAGAGAFIPLAKTTAERLAGSDSRPSLEELYPGGAADYIAKRKSQVEKLISARLVLPEELDSYTAQAKYPQ